MKSTILLVAIFCIFSFRSHAQTSRYSIANGEYANFILDNSTQILYGIGASSIGQGSGSSPYGFAYACKFPVANTKIKFVAAGLHTAACIDVAGNVYFTGPNEDGTMGNGTTSGTSYYFIPVTTDINGNPFTHVKNIRMSSSYFTGGAGYGALIYAIKDDGTLWVWGNTQGGYSGDGTYGKVVTRPTQVTSFPAGTVITKIIMANIAIALDANGNVWTWAGNGSPDMLGNTSQTDYMRPHTITLPSKAVDIAGGSYFSYALLDNHSLYGWGLFTGYLGVGSNPASVMWGTNPPAKPILLDAELNLPAKINKLSTNTATTYAILTDGSLWAWGGNECGQVGNGQELDYKRYTNNPAPYGGSISVPYAWNQDLNSVQLQQHKPVNIAPGMNNFTDLSEGVEMVFYKYAVDANGQLYSWGRNKVGVLGNGIYEADYINGMLGSLYPNSWDVPYVTAINPFVTGGKTILATSPLCLSNPGANFCNLYVNPANTPPKSLINGVKNGASSVTGTSTSLDGTLSTDNVAIMSYVWTQVSGPNSAIVSIPSGKKVNILGMTTGTYVFKLKVTDNGWASDSTTFTVNVNTAAPQPPVASAGTNQTITLPANSVTLTGSGSEVNGTIASYKWTQQSGPGTATFTAPAAASTSVAGLIAGNYIFALTVTDKVAKTATATVQVTVNAALAATPPTAGLAIPGQVEAESYSTMSGIITEITTDVGGGRGVGAIDQNDWMYYNVNVAAAGTYTVSFRIATIAPGAGFQLKQSNGTVLATVTLPNTGGYQTWQTVTATVPLSAGAQTLQLYSTSVVHWNINWMQFVASASGVDIIPGKIEAENYDAMSGIITETTTDAGGGRGVGAIDQKDWMNYNVNVAAAGTYTVSFRIATIATGAGFQLRQSNGTVLATVSLPNTGGYQVWQTVTATVTLPAGAQTLQLYSTSVVHWNINWMQFIASGVDVIPGKIEAENYDAMSGVITETTTDAGGGRGVGAIDQKDWMNYNVNVAAAGTYTVSFRIATIATGAGFQLRQSNGTVLATVTLPNTGGYQVWQTVSATVTLPAGAQTLQLYSTSLIHWNINWMQFSSGTVAAASTQEVVTASRENLLSDSTSVLNVTSSFVLYPNPVQGQFMIQLSNGYMGNMQVRIVDAAGIVRQVYSYTKNQSSMQLNMSAGNLSAGVYFVRVQIGAWSEIKKIIKL